MKNQNVKAIENYSICYPEHLNLAPDETVEVIKSEDTNSDWFGWHYCKDKNGKEGWISNDYMIVEGSSGKILKSYTAKELNATVGDEFFVLYNSCGWSWCKNSNGEEGWLPNNILRNEEEN